MEMKATIREDRLYIINIIYDLINTALKIINPILINNPDISRNSIEYKRMDNLETNLIYLKEQILKLHEIESK